jgi:hypothetical protein
MRGAPAAAAALVLTALLAACGGGGSTTSTSGTSPTPSGTTSSSASSYTGPPAVLPVPGSTITLSDGPAPWPPPAVVDNGAQSAAYVAAAGLPYNQEMLTVHYHAHLDVIVDGKPVTVPPYLGFVANGQNVAGLAPLHTHDGSGVIHIENNVPATFLLGQVFVEWGVRLSATCVGGYCADSTHEFAVYVDGKRRTGDPNTIVLTKHEEIAILYGAKGTLPAPPASYTFPNGL